MATVTTTHDTIEELAFALCQYSMNEKAYAAKLITLTMYEFAKNELQKTIERLSRLCYNNV